MSRMAVPAMEVVRFKEADVIATSGQPVPRRPRAFLQLDNFNDGTTENGKITKFGQTWSVADFIGVLSAGEGHSNFWIQCGETIVAADDLLKHEEDEILANGKYYRYTHTDNLPLWKYSDTDLYE